MQNNESNPYSGLVQSFMAALLATDRPTATRLILDAVDSGVPIKDIYNQVLMPSQNELGQLWQTNQISVGQEHYCTAATQLIMSQLYPRIFSTHKNGLRIVVACVGGELHEVGARMVADIFELEGWDSVFLGASTPSESIIEMVTRCNADVLGISATLHSHLPLVSEVVDAVRSMSNLDSVKILLGGRSFNIAPTMWQTFKADGYAKDANEAVMVAAKLIESRDQFTLRPT